MHAYARIGRLQTLLYSSGKIRIDLFIFGEIGLVFFFFLEITANCIRSPHFLDFLRSYRAAAAAAAAAAGGWTGEERLGSKQN